MTPPDRTTVADPSERRSLMRAAFRDVHAARLHGFALVVADGDRAAASRTATMALAAAYRRLGHLTHPERAAAWLRARVVEELRHARRSLTNAGAQPDRARALASLGASDQLIELLTRLSPFERAALLAADVEMLDPRDVATVLGTDQRSAAQIARRARARLLRASLETPDEGGPVAAPTAGADGRPVQQLVAAVATRANPPIADPPARDVHASFVGWLTDGGPGEPPSDAAEHAVGCGRCLQAIAIADGLRAIELGRAPLPASRLKTEAPSPIAARTVRVASIAAVALVLSVAGGATTVALLGMFGQGSTAGVEQQVLGTSGGQGHPSAAPQGATPNSRPPPWRDPGVIASASPTPSPSPSATPELQPPTPTPATPAPLVAPVVTAAPTPPPTPAPPQASVAPATPAPTAPPATSSPAPATPSPSMTLQPTPTSSPQPSPTVTPTASP